MKSRNLKIVLSFALLLASSIFYSCRKDTSSSTKITDQIQGSWELKTSFNGTTGQTEDFPKGSGNMLTFNNSNYKIYSNGTLVKGGTFQIIKEKSVVTNEIVDKIIYDQETNSIKNSVKIDNDQLTYSIDAFDGSSSIYQKK
jgi:hypothetical protein